MLHGEDPTSSTEDANLETLYDFDPASKRGTMLRYGRGSIFRFGKRPSTFRYGKRRTLFRFGKRQDDEFDQDEMEKRKILFRYGKRMDDEEDQKRGGIFRYGKRFVRDTKRQKVHTPFRFGRELEAVVEEV